MTRVAIVTGAARGIGKSIARRLYSDGFRVALTGIDVEGVERAATGLGDGALATNLRGTYLRCRVVGSYLRERASGRIVNLASDAAFKSRGASGAHYAASKAAVVVLTRRAATELAPHGVTVNAVAPPRSTGRSRRVCRPSGSPRWSARYPSAASAGRRRSPRSPPSSCPTKPATSSVRRWTSMAAL